MSEESWKSALAGNLSALRKKNGYTQSSLGEKLNYSDKSVSKWERGEGVPDVGVLIQLAALYRVSVDELLGLSNPAPKAEKKSLKWYFAALTNVTSVVLLGALIIYLLLTLLLPDLGASWLTFMAGLPVLFAALGVCFIIWRKGVPAFVTFSLALWTGCVFMQLAFGWNARVLYTAGGIVQFAAVIACGSKVLNASKKEK